MASSDNYFRHKFSPGTLDYAPAREYDLNDLDVDEEFQSRASRFLGSIGEDDDIYEYLRDSDWNLYRAGKQMYNSEKWSEEQKSDYNYLRTQFDGANLGSTSQFLELLKDATIDMVTDPTLLAALFTTPITGGSSLGARTLLGKSTTESLKLIAKGNSKKGLTNKEMKKAMEDGILEQAAKKATRVSATVSGIEGGAWMGLYNHANQNTEINTGLRRAYSAKELAGSTALGVLTAGVVGGGVQKLINHQNPLLQYSNKTSNSINPVSYYFNKSLDTFLANTVMGNARRMRHLEKLGVTKAKQFNGVLDNESQLKIGQRNKEVVEFSFPENLNGRRGDYIFEDDGFFKAIEDLAPDGTWKEADELAVIRILRGGKLGKKTSKKASKAVKKTAANLRKLFNKVAKDAEDAGYGKIKIEDYFPREWDRKKILQNRTEFEERLVAKGAVDKDEVVEVVDEMLNLNNQLYSSHSNILTHGRKFEILEDSDFEDFLINDITGVGATYFLNAANTIQAKISFLGGKKGGKGTKIVGQSETKDKDGKTVKTLSQLRQSTEELFRKEWIDPIDAELKAKGLPRLTTKDKERMVASWKSATGDVNFINGKVIQGAYDGLKLANSMAYLPLATVSSLSEGLIALAKAPTTKGLKNIQYQIETATKFLASDMKSTLKDRRGLSDVAANREANKVFIAVDDVSEDKLGRLTGDALRTPWMNKAARKYFKLSLLMPWTKNVELAAFRTGKEIIEENIKALSKMKESGIKVFDDVDLFTKSVNENAGLYKRIIKDEIEGVYTGSAKDAYNQVKYLKESLYDLGIDPKQGVKWFEAGAKTSSKFYKDVNKGGGRFARSVILPTSREFSRVPWFMTHPRYDILTQFLRYPAAFSNTVLKNFARDALNNPMTSAPKVAAFAVSSTVIARATNYWRSSKEKQLELDAGFDRRRESTGSVGQALDKALPMSWEENKRAMQRVGLFGPLEYGIRFIDSFQYNQNTMVGLSSLGGPLLGDITGTMIYGRGFFETLSRKTPLRGLKNPLENYLGVTPFDTLDKKARELDEVEVMQEVVDSWRRDTLHKGGPVHRKAYNEGGEVIPLPVKPDYSKNVESIINYMMSKNNPIFNERSIPGLLGNINVETGGSYDYQQQQENGNAWGIWQLDHSKKEDYFNYLKEQDKEDSMEAQVDYAEETMMTGRNIGGKNAKAWRGTMENGTVEEIADMWAREWERPNPDRHPQWERRISEAVKHSTKMKDRNK